MTEDSKKPPTYTKAPHLPKELSERYELILKALTGQLSVSSAARQAGLPRNHFQHLMHRAQSGLIEGLLPRPNGRPPKPESTKALEEENRRLRHQTEMQERRLEQQGKLIVKAAEVIRDQISATRYRDGSPRKTRTKSSTRKTSEPDDEGPAAQLENALELRRLGLDARCAAALVGVSPQTIRRWWRLKRRGSCLVEKRGPPSAGLRDDELARSVEYLVRQSRGLFGADALSHAVPGISRRE